MQRLDSTTLLPKVQAPILIIHGAIDEIVPVSEADALHEACLAGASASEEGGCSGLDVVAPANGVARAELLIVPQAGHNDVQTAGNEVYADGFGSWWRRLHGSS